MYTSFILLVVCNSLADNYFRSLFRSLSRIVANVHTQKSRSTKYLLQLYDILFIKSSTLGKTVKLNIAEPLDCF